MKEKLIQLRNAMVLIETRGQSTIIMADCLKYIDQLITECDNPEELSKTDVEQEIC